MRHPLAFIHPEAKIAENVIVDPFATIEKDVVIGEGTHIYSHAVVMDGARIGKNCRIFPGAVIAGIPQDLKFHGEESVAIIGDNTTIRECATINRGTESKGETRVGSNTLIMAYTHVGHDSVVGNNCIVANSTQIAGEVTIDDFAVIAVFQRILAKLPADLSLHFRQKLITDTFVYQQIVRCNAGLPHV